MVWMIVPSQKLPTAADELPRQSTESSEVSLAGLGLAVHLPLDGAFLSSRLLGHHHLGRLDHRDDLVAYSQAQSFSRLSRDR